jgi:hypothetical protein
LEDETHFNKGHHPISLLFEQRLSKSLEILKAPNLTKYSHPEDGDGMFVRDVGTKSINAD